MICMRGKRGSALAEMALLLSVYVTLVTAAMYLGSIALVKIGAQAAAGVAAGQPEEQNADDVRDQMPGYMDAKGDFVMWQTILEEEFVVSDTVHEEEMFLEEDIKTALNELEHAPVGYYTYKDGEIIYVLDEDRKGSFGRYIEDNFIKEESDEVAEIWAGWAYRSETTVSCMYEPVFGGWGPIAIDGISLSSCVRGEKERGTYPGDEPDYEEILRMLWEEGKTYASFPPPAVEHSKFWQSD